MHPDDLLAQSRDLFDQLLDPLAFGDPLCNLLVQVTGNMRCLGFASNLAGQHMSLMGLTAGTLAAWNATPYLLQIKRSLHKRPDLRQLLQLGISPYLQCVD
jgi:hypothetical protein